jgi:hypothetical protein
MRGYEFWRSSVGYELRHEKVKLEILEEAEQLKLEKEHKEELEVKSEELKKQNEDYARRLANLSRRVHEDLIPRSVKVKNDLEAQLRRAEGRSDTLRVALKGKNLIIKSREDDISFLEQNRQVILDTEERAEKAERHLEICGEVIDELFEILHEVSPQVKEELYRDAPEEFDQNEAGRWMLCNIRECILQAREAGHDVERDEEYQRQVEIYRGSRGEQGARIRSLVGQVQTLEEDNEGLQDIIRDLRNEARLKDLQGDDDVEEPQSSSGALLRSKSTTDLPGAVKSMGEKPDTKGKGKQRGFLVQAGIPNTRVKSPSRNALGTIAEEEEAEYDLCRSDGSS